MNIIDKFRIKRNPNIIDSFSDNKLNNEVVRYAIDCGYVFNTSTMEKLIDIQAYKETFKNEKEFFEYMKQSVIGSDETAKNQFYNLYSNLGRDLDTYIKIIKEDDELSQSFVSELEKWFKANPRIEYKDVIQLIDGKDELIDELLQQHFDTLKNKRGFQEFAKYITTLKTPKELYEQNIIDPKLTIAFIEDANPQNFMELFEQFDFDDFFKNKSLILSAIDEHIEQFVPYLDRLDESYKTKMDKSLVTEDIKNKVLGYLKENNISFNKNIPKFVLDNEEYVLQSITQNPVSLQAISEIREFPLEKHEREAEEIAKKISEDQIKFEGILPKAYLLNQQVFESIVAVNPELLQQAKNTLYIDNFIKGMTDEEAFEYYKKLGVPFNKDTVIATNILSVVECLRNDRDTLSHTYREYTNEEYKKIYEQIKDDITPEEVLQNKFLAQNPYFARYLIKSEADLSNYDFQEIKHYEEFYLKLQATAIKRGITLPEPKSYKDIIKFTKEGRVYIELNDLDSVKKGLEYLKNNEIKQDLFIKIPQNENKEFIISDNIDFFEKLAEDNININFKYNTGANEISLKQVIDNEHFMQHVAEDIKSKNFSPLEELIAVYDITKVFKPYKEDKSSHNSSASRGLYEYLGNEYMVCAGYADLINNLGHRLGLNVSKIHLDLDKFTGETEGHARNYSNIVDSKYGIDGFYVLEPTWEQNGIAKSTSGRGTCEYARSSYTKFLQTTEEGRNNYKDGKIIVEGYDDFLTSNTPDELRRAISKNKFDVYTIMELLDPDFSKKIEGLNIDKDDDANVVIDYFKSKINKPVPKKTLLDAIINVKKTIYLNYSEQDFEDMRMGYSTVLPFGNYGSNYQIDSLYGKEYDEFIERRYNDIKDIPIKQAEEENPQLMVTSILTLKRKEALKDDKIFAKYNSSSAFRVTDKKYLDLLRQNEDKLKNIGFEIEDTEEEINDENLILKFPKIERGLPISKDVEILSQYKKQLYVALGLEKDKTQTQKLGEQTLEEQNDTIGKNNVQSEISRQLENEKIQNDQIIE